MSTYNITQVEATLQPISIDIVLKVARLSFLYYFISERVQMKNQDAVEVVTVQKAEEQLGLSHGKIVSLIAEGKLKWTTVEGSVHVELPRNQRRREALIKKSQ